MRHPHTRFRFIWIPRTLMVAFILFLTMFSLDVFSMEGSLLAKLGGFLIHSVPSLILVVVLLVSWKSSLWSGILCLVFAVAFMLRFQMQGIAEFLMLVLPVIVVGALFIVSHFTSRKPSPTPDSRP
jgi:hypothetical protein